jgi:cob(I)alamin adenosyltransferase
MSEAEQVLFMVFTGNGKGKSSAALGLTFRALGHGQKVCFIQFIKGSWKYGELETAKKFPHLLDFYVMGRGFTWKSDDIDKDIAVAREGWQFACRIISENRHQLVVLDELTYLATYSMIDEAEMIDVITHRDPAMHVVVTGRGAGEDLIATADLVTEMREIKHPFARGIKAQKGIEF